MSITRRLLLLKFIRYKEVDFRDEIEQKRDVPQNLLLKCDVINNHGNTLSGLIHHLVTNVMFLKEFGLWVWLQVAEFFRFFWESAV